MNMRKIASVVVAGMLAASCATTGGAGGGQARTEVEKAMGTCVAAIAVGALVGAVIGNNTGSGSADRGAGAGALLGAGACGVLLVMANARDKQRIAELQIAAAAAGSSQSATYTGDDGKMRRIETVVRGDVPDPEYTPSATPAPDATTPAPTAAPRLCRRVDTTMAVEGAQTVASVNNQITCREADGTWVTLRTPGGSRAA